MNIFLFDDIVDYLNALLESKKRKNSNFSLRSWAKNLGYKFPSYLSQCLRNERAVNFSLVKRVVEKEGLTVSEKEFLVFLFLKHQVRGVEGMCLENMTEMMKNVIQKNKSLV